MFFLSTYSFINSFIFANNHIQIQQQSTEIYDTLKIIYTILTASYPDVSLLMKMCAQRKAGRRQPAVSTLPMVPCGSSPVTRFALASAMRKTEAPEEEAAVLTKLFTKSHV